MIRPFEIGLCTLTSLCRFTSAEIKAGDGLDYSKLAFYPDRWKPKKVDTPPVSMGG
ncbi:MAG: hypothetical protein OSB05_00055 [Akkermansiaceae bacterium]|nr:hypothetical protein [Akkermansiaceae bacterium]